MMMTLVVVLAELSLVLAIVLTYITWKSVRRRTRERAAVKTFATSINTKQQARTQKLTDQLKRNGQLSDADALNKANEIIKKQNRYYQDAIDLYCNRDHAFLTGLDSRLEELLEQYSTIMPVKPDNDAGISVADESAEKLSSDVVAMNDKLEELRAENDVLRCQLKATEQELNQLGQEYMSAFNVRKARSNAPVTEQELLADEGVVGGQVADLAQAIADDIEKVKPVLVGDEESKDRGLLQELDLSELIGKDAGPAAAEAVSKT